METKEKMTKSEVDTKEVAVPAPTGAGKFDDMVTVTGSSKHPTLAGHEFQTHSAHVPYLQAKGFISKTEKV